MTEAIVALMLSLSAFACTSQPPAADEPNECGWVVEGVGNATAVGSLNTYQASEGCALLAVEASPCDSAPASTMPLGQPVQILRKAGSAVNCSASAVSN